MELSQLELGGKKGYPICTYCHGNGFDVVTHGKAVQTGSASKKATGKRRAAQHKGIRGCRGDDDAADTQYFFGGDGEVGRWSTTSATSHHMCSRAACRSNSHDRLHGWQQRHQRHERHQQPMACAGSIPAQCSAAAALASERGRSSSCSSSGSSSSSNLGSSNLGSSSSSSRGGRGTGTRLHRLPQLLLGCLCSTQSVCEVPECLCALCGCPCRSALCLGCSELEKEAI